MQALGQSPAQPVALPALQPAALPAWQSGWTKDWSSAPTLTAAARAHVAAQTAFRANQADASTGLAAALSGTVPQQLRPSPSFEDIAARPVGTTTAVKLFNSASRPPIGEMGNPDAESSLKTQAPTEQREDVEASLKTQ